jgi:hypothetical protein
MKTHSAAKTLRMLANVLESLPNMELSKLANSLQNKDVDEAKQFTPSIMTLYALSKTSKQEWRKRIIEYGFPINISPRDSSRDIIGKLFKYLDNNPEAQNIMKTKVKDTKKEQSALDKALDILLEGQEHENITL